MSASASSPRRPNLFLIVRPSGSRVWCDYDRRFLYESSVSSKGKEVLKCSCHRVPPAYAPDGPGGCPGQIYPYVAHNHAGGVGDGFIKKFLLTHCLFFLCALWRRRPSQLQYRLVVDYFSKLLFGPACSLAPDVDVPVLFNNAIEKGNDVVLLRGRRDTGKPLMYKGVADFPALIELTTVFVLANCKPVIDVLKPIPPFSYSELYGRPLPDPAVVYHARLGVPGSDLLIAVTFLVLLKNVSFSFLYSCCSSDASYLGWTLAN